MHVLVLPVHSVLKTACGDCVFGIVFFVEYCMQVGSFAVCYLIVGVVHSFPQKFLPTVLHWTTREIPQVSFFVSHISVCG